MLDTSYYWHFEKALKDWMEEVKPRIWTLTGHRATKQFSVDLGLYRHFNDLHLLKVFRWNRCNFITSKYWALCKWKSNKIIFYSKDSMSTTNFIRKYVSSWFNTRHNTNTEVRAKANKASSHTIQNIFHHWP